MPFTDILTIKPDLDPSSLRKMEKTLSSRFTGIAKKFGSGIKNVLLGTAGFGVAGTIIDKLLNPLQEVKESIDKALQNADQLDTGAGQFNTTTGKLARLQAFGSAKGIDPDQLNMLMTKFQAAVAENKLDPTKSTAVANFANNPDQAEGFFDFIQAIQKLGKIDKNAAISAQAQVFGEKQIGKISEFMQADFQELAAKFAAVGVPSTDAVTAAVKKSAEIEDTQAILRAARAQRDLVTKGEKITPEMMNVLDQGEQATLDKENYRLKGAKDLAKIQQSTEKLAFLLEKAYIGLAPFLAKIPGILETIGGGVVGVAKSRVVRGMTTDGSKRPGEM